MNDQSLKDVVAELRRVAREVGSDDDNYTEGANAARNKGLELNSYWAGAIDGHHVCSAAFLNALDDILPEPEEERCSECGQVKEQA